MRGTVLIVDDEASMSSIVSFHLERVGYICESVTNGNEALWRTFIKDFDENRSRKYCIADTQTSEAAVKRTDRYTGTHPGKEQLYSFIEIEI